MLAGRMDAIRGLSIVAGMLLFSGCVERHAAIVPPPPAVRTPEVAAPPPRINERVVDLGTSVDGRPIRMHVFGDAPWPTLILGGIHGNEPSSSFVCQRLIETIRANPSTLGGRCVAIIPDANPDGLARKLRTNARLVDLNRNFAAANWKKTRKGTSFGGEKAESEPETLAILRAFEQINPARVISVHSMDQPCNNYDGPAKHLADAMHAHNGYAVKDNIGYATPGSLGSWAGIDRRIPIVTLELPRKQAGDAAWEANRAAIFAVIRYGDATAASAR
jgi:predicted deacylase